MTSVIFFGRALRQFYAWFGPYNRTGHFTDYVMKFSPSQPIMIPAKNTVLLVFVPAVPSWDTVQASSLPVLTDTLQQQLGISVPILMLNETLHADVVRSFNVHQLPAFVLVQQGVELWRHEGMLNDDTRINLADWLLNG